ncbi:hypothetical protein GCM10009117_13620 [Gangjinia marincola]|uniref:Outer membrane protein beta-barrel domain-containing protein n=2 Tax=Gangjinia marincola TaxID=578463 RepID=A0ABP3XSL5_9FLAO
MCSYHSNAQQFGLTGGYLNLTSQNETPTLDTSDSDSGFYVGTFIDLDLTDKIHLQPSLLYGNVNDLNLIYLPVMLKYYLGGTGLNIQAGPQATLLLEDIDDLNNFGVDLSVGAAYDIFSSVFIELRYSFELTDRASDSINYDSSTLRTLSLGIGINI